MTQQAKALATTSNVQNPHSGRSKLTPQSCLWPPHTCHSMEPPKHKHIHIIHTHTHHSHTNNSKQIKILKQEIVAMNSSWEETFKTSSVHISSFRYSTPHALNKLFCFTGSLIVTTTGIVLRTMDSFRLLNPRKPFYVILVDTVTL